MQRSRVVLEGRKLAPSTINPHLSAIRALADKCAESGLLDPPTAAALGHELILHGHRVYWTSTAALKSTVGYHWALWQQVQGILARSPAPRWPGSPYARWYDGPRADALRGYHPDVAPQWCSACSRAVLAVFKLPRRYGRAAPVCSACYLEVVGRSALVPWRDPVGE